MSSIMAGAKDIEWGEAAAGTWIGSLGGFWGVIGPHPALQGIEARLYECATRYGEPYATRTIQEAMTWVERELLRLANRPIGP